MATLGLVDRTRLALKQFWTPPTSSGWALGAGLSKERSYGRDVGDGTRSSLVEACVSWIANAFTQAVPVVMRYSGDDHFGEADRRHPAARLIRRPTYDPVTGRSYYSWIPLIKATVMSVVADGNGYWRKRRSVVRRPAQIWYIPHWMMEPKHQSGSGDFVSYYEYRVNGQRAEVDPEDIVHFRDSIDPDNQLKGVSKLRKLLREIFTDEEAARWTAALLRNNGVPGVVIAPDAGAAAPSEDEAKLIKARFMEDFTGDRRGEPIVLGAPTKVQQYGFSPENMKLGELRDIPEERVSAVLGIPAAVAGLGAGLQTAKVGATMAELVDLAWQNGVLPLSRLIAGEITEQLLPDFEVSNDIEFAFDTSRVPIMADYQFKIAQKHEMLVKGGIEMRSEARRANQLKTSSDDDVYVIQAGVTMVKPDGKPLFTPPAPARRATDALPPPPAPPALPAGEPPAKGLTKRENEIADFLIKAMTNRQIGEQLVISERTVDRHVENILGKLGLSSRTQLAEWAENAKSADMGELRGEVKRLADEFMTRPEPQVLPAPVVNVSVPPTPRRRVVKEVLNDDNGNIIQIIETEEEVD